MCQIFAVPIFSTRLPGQVAAISRSIRLAGNSRVLCACDIRSETGAFIRVLRTAERFRLRQVFHSAAVLQKGENGEVSSSNVPSALIFIPLLISLGAIVLRRRRLALRHAKVVGQGKSVEVRLDPPQDDGANPQLRRASRVLNRRTEVPTGRLDVGSTIKTTAAAAGNSCRRGSEAHSAQLASARRECGPGKSVTGIWIEALEAIRSESRETRTLRIQEDARMGAEGWTRPVDVDRADYCVRPTDPSADARRGGQFGRRRYRWTSQMVGPEHLPATIVLLTPKSRETWGVAEAQAAQAGAVVTRGCRRIVVAGEETAGRRPPAYAAYSRRR